MKMALVAAAPVSNLSSKKHCTCCRMVGGSGERGDTGYQVRRFKIGVAGFERGTGDTRDGWERAEKGEEAVEKVQEEESSVVPEVGC